ELPRPLVRRVVARLLAPYAARDCLDRFPSLRARLEASLLGLRQSASEVAEDALCEALADPARAAAMAALVREQTRSSPRIAPAPGRACRRCPTPRRPAAPPPPLPCGGCPPRPPRRARCPSRRRPPRGHAATTRPRRCRPGSGRTSESIR